LAEIGIDQQHDGVDAWRGLHESPYKQMAGIRPAIQIYFAFSPRVWRQL
jgi:hypothetical protein